MSTDPRAASAWRQVTIITLVITLVLAPAGAALAKDTGWTYGAAPDSLWSNPGNWDNGIPSFFDIVYFDPIGGTSTMDIFGLELQEMDMTGYTGIVFLSHPLVVHGNATIESAFELNTQPLDVVGNLAVAGILNAQSTSLTVGGDLNVAFHLDGSSGANIVWRDRSTWDTWQRWT